MLVRFSRSAIFGRLSTVVVESYSLSPALSYAMLQAGRLPNVVHYACDNFISFYKFRKSNRVIMMNVIIWARECMGCVCALISSIVI